MRRLAALRPFWRYYGGKWASARRYPDPRFVTIIEPFAGAAGYSCHWHWRNVVLVDKSPVVAGIWRYLIAATEREILALPDIPEGGTVDDVGAPQEARWLMGFWCNGGVVTPRKSPSKWARSGDGSGSQWLGWGDRSRRRVASQVSAIRHWRVIEGDYWLAGDGEACWFVAPPYSTPAGSEYPYQPVPAATRVEWRPHLGGPDRSAGFAELGKWCRTRPGQTIVCEQEGSDWLPFRRLGAVRSSRGRSSEVVWTSDLPRQPTLPGVPP